MGRIVPWLWRGLLSFLLGMSSLPSAGWPTVPKRAVFILVLALVGGCYSPDLRIDGVRVHCIGGCPPEKDIRAAMDTIAGAWAPYVDAWPVWQGWAITFSDGPMYAPELVAGATFYNSGRIYIGTEWPCEPRGLCAGVFDWELGLVLAEHINPRTTELEKLEWRMNRGLINELGE